MSYHPFLLYFLTQRGLKPTPDSIFYLSLISDSSLDLTSDIIKLIQSSDIL